MHSLHSTILIYSCSIHATRLLQTLLLLLIWKEILSPGFIHAFIHPRSSTDSTMALLLAISALLAFTSGTSATSTTAPPMDKYYDCQFRSLAMSYAEQHVLNEWPSATR